MNLSEKIEYWNRYCDENKYFDSIIHKMDYDLINEFLKKKTAIEVVKLTVGLSLSSTYFTVDFEGKIDSLNDIHLLIDEEALIEYIDEQL